MGLSVAVVGATGAVGGEFLELFEQRAFPVSELRLLASERSVGKTLTFRNEEVPIRLAEATAFDGVDVAFFSAGAAQSRALAPSALDHGALVVDNSSAFRMDPDVPLVVPEINLHSVTPANRLIANPNCSAIILLMAVYPLLGLGRVARLIVSTYQSASGGGATMMQRLLDETREFLEPNGSKLPDAPHPPYAFNVFSHNSPIGPDGYNEEESKVIAESRKILSLPDLPINVTCVRVPVLRAHTESVTIEFDGPAPEFHAAKSALSGAPGVRVVDDRTANRFPTPQDASGRWEILVGRIRQDLSNPNALCLLVSGDQLLKGAALNAVQIAEGLLL